MCTNALVLHAEQHLDESLGCHLPWCVALSKVMQFILMAQQMLQASPQQHDYARLQSQPLARIWDNRTDPIDLLICTQQDTVCPS